MAITKPYTFVAGTKAKAVEVNEDFDVLYTETNRIGTEIINIELDIQDVNNSKANINGDATQRFQLANPENSYDGVNKNYLEGAIANVKDYISGYVITKNTNNSIIVSSGSCYDSTFKTIISSTGNITKTNSTQSANTTYYVYAISDDNGYNANILIATSSVTPPLPSGYTLFRRIGSYNTNASNQISIIKNYGNNYNVPSAKATIVDYYKSGNSWYRIWSDGWIEQGGLTADLPANRDSTVELLKPFTTTTYYINCNQPMKATYSFETCGIVSRSTTNFVVHQKSYNNDGGAFKSIWYACGY